MKWNLAWLQRSPLRELPGPLLSKAGSHAGRWPRPSSGSASRRRTPSAALSAALAAGGDVTFWLRQAGHFPGVRPSPAPLAASSSPAVRLPLPRGPAALHSFLQHFLQLQKEWSGCHRQAAQAAQAASAARSQGAGGLQSRPHGAGMEEELPRGCQCWTTSPFGNVDIIRHTDDLLHF